MIIISKYLVPRGFIGLTLFPFIFLKNTSLKENMVLINHEKIHLRQQLELLIVFFYIFYVLEWFVKLIIYKNRKLAYENISFEREAYLYEKEYNYLKRKRIWSFWKYI